MAHVVASANIGENACGENEVKPHSDKAIKLRQGALLMAAARRQC